MSSDNQSAMNPQTGVAASPHDITGAGGEEVSPAEWRDLVFSEPEPPEDWVPGPSAFAEHPPPQLIRTVNLLPIPQHRLAADDVQGIAETLLARARQGIGDIFAHDDYGGLSSETEGWARTIAEHQTGIPYTMPVYFHDGPQKRIAQEITGAGRYPLAGQCQQSVTTALCFGGWGGGALGDIGSGIDAQLGAASLGQGWTGVPGSLKSWPEDLWEEVTVGSCLFWSAPCPLTKGGQTCTAKQHVSGCGKGSGHVAVVIRKHPTDRKWQLWDTGTSFYDPVTHPAAAKGARMLWESHWWEWIPQSMSSGWVFRGLARVGGLGAVKGGLRPRGRCRLLLTRRSDRRLLYRSAWLSMEKEGLPISWLLRSLRGAPFFDRIEATWCINSARDVHGPASPDNRPLLDCRCDTKGNAIMSWKPVQGLHDRPNRQDWLPGEPFLAGDPSSLTKTTAAAAASAAQGDPAGADEDPYA